MILVHNTESRCHCKQPHSTIQTGQFGWHKAFALAHGVSNMPWNIQRKFGDTHPNMLVTSKEYRRLSQEFLVMASLHLYNPCKVVKCSGWSWPAQALVGGWGGSRQEVFQRRGRQVEGFPGVFWRLYQILVIELNQAPFPRQCRAVLGCSVCSVLYHPLKWYRSE